MRLILFILSIAALSCGHFEGPRYSGQNEYRPQGSYSPQSGSSSQKGPPSEEGYSSTDELYRSDEVLKNPQRRWERGPFVLQWPVRKVKINRGFIGSGHQTHLGLDIGGRKGDPILAAHDGIVIYAGSGFRGYGKMIIIEYSPNWATLYAHLSGFKVRTGQEVSAGQVIGRMGRTGRATGVHLHFELMRDKEPINPEPYLNGPGNVAKYADESRVAW